MDNQFYNLLQSKSLNEFDAEKLLAHEELYCGYKDFEGRYLDISKNGFVFYTKKAFTSKHEIVNKHELDLCHKEHKIFALFYSQHDKLTQRNTEWTGLEPGYYMQEFVFALNNKKPVIDSQGSVIGAFYHCLKIFHGSSLNSLLETLQFCKNILPTDNNTKFELYKPSSDINLTNREMDCLFYTLRGKNAKTTASMLNISAKTVEFHLTHIKEKFNCFSKSQLIEKAIALGYLNKIPSTMILRNMK